MSKINLKNIIKREWVKETEVIEFEYFLDEEDCDIDDYSVPYIRKGPYYSTDGGCVKKAEYDRDVPKIMTFKAKRTREIYTATLECGHKVYIKASDPRKKMKCWECE